MAIIKSIEKAFIILNCFEQKESLGITEIVDLTKLSKSTVYDMVTTLKSVGALSQNENTRKYTLGIRLFELGNLYKNRNPLKKRAEKICQQLALKHNATVHLATFDTDRVVYIEKYENPNNIVNYSRTGKKAPLTCTGLGKAILSHLNDEYKNTHIYSKELPKFTENSITTKAEMENELEITRLRGYSIDNEEIELGLKCVAAPIFGINSEVLGALSISKLAPHMTEEVIPQLGDEIKAASREISFDVSAD